MEDDQVLTWCLARVGTEVHVGEWLTITQERIDRFATATDDFQWIHVDAARAKAESPWKSTIAHGFLTLSLYPKLREAQAGAVAWPGVRTVINYGVNRVRFMNAVRVGSQIRLRSTLKSVEPAAGAVQVEEECVFEIGGETKPACVADVVLRLYA